MLTPQAGIFALGTSSHAYLEETQEALALLKILALASQHVDRGEITPISEVAARLHTKAPIPDALRGLADKGRRA
jgi:hypothetical protein